MPQEQRCDASAAEFYLAQGFKALLLIGIAAGSIGQLEELAFQFIERALDRVGEIRHRSLQQSNEYAAHAHRQIRAARQ